MNGATGQIAQAGLSVFDIVALIIVAIAAIRAAIKGFVSEITGLAGLVAGLLLASLFSNALAPVFEGWLGHTPWNQVIAFVAIFAVVFVIMLLLRGALRTIVEGLNIQGFDHFFGFLFGLIWGLVICYILLFLLNVQKVVDVGPELHKSIVWQLLSPFLSYADAVVNTANLPSMPKLPSLPSILPSLKP